MSNEDKAELARSMGLDIKVINEVESHFWTNVKKSLMHPDMPMIKIRDFGVFKPKYNRVKYLIWSAIKAIREGKNVEENKVKLRHWWGIRNRMIVTRQTKYYG